MKEGDRWGQRVLERSPRYPDEPAVHGSGGRGFQTEAGARPEVGASAAWSGSCREASVIGVIEGRVDRPEARWEPQAGPGSASWLDVGSYSQGSSKPLTDFRKYQYAQIYTVKRELWASVFLSTWIASRFVLSLCRFCCCCFCCYGHAHGLWMFPGQELNLSHCSHSCNLHRTCSNAGSFNPLHQARDQTHASAS